MDEFYCEYALPCGWCEKLEKQCPKLSESKNNSFEEQDQNYCEHSFELIDEQVYYPSVRKMLKCKYCGFEKIQYMNM